MNINTNIQSFSSQSGIKVTQNGNSNQSIDKCKNRSKPDNDARVRPDAKTEFNRTVKRCSTGH